MQSSQDPRRIRSAGWPDQDAASRAWTDPPRTPTGVVLRRLAFPSLAVLLCLAALVYGSLTLGPGIQVARGEAVPGTFHVLWQYCHNGCNARGDFVSDDGSIRREDVDLYDASRRDGVDSEVRALDSGNPFGVYPATGSHGWIWSIIHLILGSAGLLGWIWRYPLRALRRRRRAGSASGSPGQP
ncbi:hypothetical protein [Rugosimonospora acidiphila]|uniref:hypothetical protein n=1 Tax=Rugosimonospora acidiphila TaxID=556531 RepID=UPI0031E88E97